MPSSFSNTLNSDEVEILNKFRKSVADILEPKHDDYYLLRWLRARNLKLREAEEMFRKHMAWRKLARADDILQIHKRLPVVSKYWPLGMIGYDKLGCPVSLLRYGETDLKGLTFSTRRSEFMSEFVHYTELMEDLMRKRNQKHTSPAFGVLLIVDMTNFLLHHSTCSPVFSRFKDILTWLEANYPESLRSLYIINAPTIFQVFLKLIKPFMNEKTFNKIHVYGKSGWKEKLVEDIDEAVLPVSLGGKGVGPNNDVNAFDLVLKGDTVPKSYYIQCKLYNEEKAKTVQIEPKSCYTIEMIVDKPKSVLNWEFKTKDHNVEFGVIYVRDGDLEEEIVPPEKKNCHIIPECGSWLCEKLGTYVLKFDNSFSWMRPKTLTYWAEIVPPGKK